MEMFEECSIEMWKEELIGLTGRKKREGRQTFRLETKVFLSKFAISIVRAIFYCLNSHEWLWCSSNGYNLGKARQKSILRNVINDWSIIRDSCERKTWLTRSFRSISNSVLEHCSFSHFSSLMLSASEAFISADAILCNMSCRYGINRNNLFVSRTEA